jgi:hypothetical protein
MHKTENKIKLVHVPVLYTPHRAVLEEHDFDKLIRIGVSPPYRFHQGQVVHRCNGRNIALSRLIYDCDKGYKIILLDQDQFNLRRSNLVRSPGSSKHRARDLLVREFKRFKPELKHTTHFQRGSLNYE